LTIERPTPPPAISPPPPGAARPRIALAHDWLCGFRGGEVVLERIAAAAAGRFEVAGLYTMFDDGRPLSPAVDALRARGLIHASPLSRPPGALKLRRWLLPLYPRAVAGLSRRLHREHQVRPIDLLISTSSAAIKGLRTPPGVPHVCYCHSPARYVWSRRGDYGGTGVRAALRRAGLRLYAEPFKTWDRRSAANVTTFIANSRHTAAEIARCWGRASVVVHPPVRTDFFTAGSTHEREDFWLVVSALEPYKRIDLAIRAAALARARLVIAGTGSQRRALERLARKARARAEFRGRIDDEELRRLYRAARLMVFPQVEDFGIAAAEAVCCGCPVIARRQGGALDIVEAGLSGSWFSEAEPEAVAAAAADAPAPGFRIDAARWSGESFDRAFWDAALGVPVEK
jgi:glycosyltransferase involved in cell wall biosynthesis